MSVTRPRCSALTWEGSPYFIGSVAGSGSRRGGRARLSRWSLKPESRKGSGFESLPLRHSVAPVWLAGRAIRYSVDLRRGGRVGRGARPPAKRLQGQNLCPGFESGLCHFSPRAGSARMARRHVEGLPGSSRMRRTPGAHPPSRRCREPPPLLRVVPRPDPPAGIADSPEGRRLWVRSAPTRLTDAVGVWTSRQARGYGVELAAPVRFTCREAEQRRREPVDLREAIENKAPEGHEALGRFTSASHGERPGEKLNRCDPLRAIRLVVDDLRQSGSSP